MNDYIPVIAAVAFAVVTWLVFSLYRTLRQKERDNHEIVASMTMDAVFIAIILVMTFVPYLGYIAVTPFISLTLLHLPVLLGAALGGWKKGILFGLVFGFSSYVQALSSAGFNALFAFPWVAIPPRVAFGFLAGLSFSFIGKISKKKTIGLYLALACAVLTALHTGLVFLDLFLFYPDTVGGLFASTEPVAQATTFTFAVIILLGMLGEMAVAAAIVPPLYSASRRVLSIGRKRLRTR